MNQWDISEVFFTMQDSIWSLLDSINPHASSYAQKSNLLDHLAIHVADSISWPQLILEAMTPILFPHFCEDALL